MDPRDLILAAQLDSGAAARLLAGYGFEDPAEADRRLQQIAQSVGRPRLLADAVEGLLETLARSADPDGGLRVFESLLESVSSPAQLLAWLNDVPPALDVAARLPGHSPFLGQTLVRSPEHLYWLTEGDRLKRCQTAEYFAAEVDAAVRPARGSLKAALDGLRRLKRREILRIGSQQLLLEMSLEQIASQLSELAAALIEGSLRSVAGEAGCELVPAVLAMGKLGGGELNFSSDVDLVFVHADGGDEAACRAIARRLAAVLAEVSEAGHLYRVDLRLRPMGSGGEITYSESATRTYYQHWADTADRVALLKCRAVAGDVVLGRRWVESLRDFVYRRYLDQAAIEEIRWFKKRIDRQQKHRSPERNVKLGLGGIREVEFFVQSLQLLYGGRQPQLQSPNTLEALRRLQEAGLIGTDEAATLSDAYVFLRRVEHCLQLVADRQTHHLPEDSVELRRLAIRLGITGDDARQQLQKRLRACREQVHELFQSLFPSRPGQTALQRLLLSQQVDETEVVQDLERTGLARAEAVVEGFKTLAAAGAFPHSPGRIRNLLANLAPQLLQHAGSSDDPARLLSRLDSFADAFGARGDLYLTLADDELLTQRLFRVLAISDFLGSRLIRHPELLDGLVRPAAPIDAGAALATVAVEGNRTLALLRRIKARDEFKIGAASLLDGACDGAPQQLTRLAERCLELACRRALAEHPQLAEVPFAVIALGKLGGRELTFRSDLDLVVVQDDGRSVLAAERVLPLIRSIRRTLHSYTRQGRAYEIDLRLRPEGRKGIEITPLSLLRHYFQHRADEWERLAWRKRRAVFTHEWEIEAADLFDLRPFDDNALAQLDRIRRRKENELAREDGRHFDLKNGRGGLLDVQFVTGVAAAAQGLSEPSTADALLRLSPATLHADDRDALLEGFRFLSRLEQLLELLDETAGDRISTRPEANRVLADLAGMESSEALLDRYREVTGRNREIYRRVVGRS